METLSAFDKDVSRYFGRVIEPNLEHCARSVNPYIYNILDWSDSYGVIHLY